MRFDLWVRKIPWRRKWQSTSSILAWEIPWTEEPDGLQSMGSQRIGHDLAMQHIVPKTSPPSLHPWLWLCGHLVNQGASSVWNLNHSNPYYFFSYLAIEKGLWLAFSCCLLLLALQAEKVWKPVPRVWHPLGLCGWAYSNLLPTEKKGSALGALLRALRQEALFLRAIKGEAQADFSVFWQLLLLSFPLWGNQLAGSERGRINKSNLKYALEFSYFWRSLRWKMAED